LPAKTFALFFAVPLPLVWVLVFWAPFGSPVQVFPSPFSGIPVVLLAVVQGALVGKMMGCTSRRELIRLFALWGFFSWAGVFSLAVLIHQDFFSTGFMFIVQMVILRLFLHPVFREGPELAAARTRFFVFGLVFCVLFSLWIILMGFALVTRQEPRWWESLLYNSYNAVLAAFSYWATLRVADRPPRKVISTPEFFSVDQLDFSAVIGQGGCLCAWYLLGSSERVTCSALLSKEGRQQCLRCTEAKVSQCTAYKSLYNNMRLVRRLFEALQLGTIRGPEERSSVASQGWKFHPRAKIEFEDGPSPVQPLAAVHR